MGEYKLELVAPVGRHTRLAFRAHDVSGLSEEELAAFTDTEVVDGIGDRIKRRRDAIGRARGKRFGQQELADLVGVAKATISYWESNKLMPQMSNRPKLLEVLNCSAEWLFGGHGAPPSDMETYRPTGQAIRLSTVIVRGTLPNEEGDLSFSGEVVGSRRRPPGLQDSRLAYCFQMRGDSMAPVFEDGSDIYVDPARGCQMGDYVVIELHPKSSGANVVIVRRLTFRRGSTFEVWQSEPDKRTELLADDIVSMHRILRLEELLSL